MGKVRGNIFTTQLAVRVFDMLIERLELLDMRLGDKRIDPFEKYTFEFDIYKLCADIQLREIKHTTGEGGEECGRNERP